MTSYQQTGRRVDLEKRVAAVEQENVQLKKGIPSTQVPVLEYS